MFKAEKGFEKHLNSKCFEVHHFDHDNAPSRELWYYKPSALSQWQQSLPKPTASMACDDERGQHITEAFKHAGIQIPEKTPYRGIELPNFNHKFHCKNFHYSSSWISALYNAKFKPSKILSAISISKSALQMPKVPSISGLIGNNNFKND